MPNYEWKAYSFSFFADVSSHRYSQSWTLFKNEKGGHETNPCHAYMVINGMLYFKSHFLKCFNFWRFSKRSINPALNGMCFLENVTGITTRESFCFRVHVPTTFSSLPSFLFARMYPAIDICSIFRYEPEHYLPSRVNRMFNDYSVYMPW